MIDPGPDLPEHLDALEKAIGGRQVAAIMCTHTHRDHSPAARPLAERTGAPIIGCAPLALETVGPRADAVVRRRLCRRTACWPTATRSRSTAKPVTAVATPGHTSNHLCFAYRGALVQRRPCDGLVDDRGRSARRRHGRLHGEPRQAAAARRSGLLSGARARRSPTRSNMCGTWSATGCSARSRS